MADAPTGESNAVRYGCVGCLTTVAGLFSGGMMGVLIAKFVGSARNCAPPPDLPACDWHVYAGVGMLIGAVTLPVLALVRLRSSDAKARNSD
jgi:branched-subunit amino acid permease